MINMELDFHNLFRWILMCMFATKILSPVKKPWDPECETISKKKKKKKTNIKKKGNKACHIALDKAGCVCPLSMVFLWMGRSVAACGVPQPPANLSQTLPCHSDGKPNAAILFLYPCVFSLGGWKLAPPFSLDSTTFKTLGVFNKKYIATLERICIYTGIWMEK